jgi:hypothetical protein
MPEDTQAPQEETDGSVERISRTVDSTRNTGALRAALLEESATQNRRSNVKC